MIIKLFLYFASISLLSATDKLVDTVGGGEVLLPPIFSETNKNLVDTTKDKTPTKKALKDLEKNFKDGDIVFIRSTSKQSKALEEVTGSHWTLSLIHI